MKLRQGILGAQRKVCILTCVHSPFDARVFHKEAMALAEAGHEITIVASQCDDQQINRIRVKAVPTPGNRFERMLLTAWRVWKAGLDEKADVYHFHDPELVVPCLAFKLFGYKVIYDVHEDLPKDILQHKDYIPRWARRCVASVADAVEKSASRVFDAVVPATDEIAKGFSECRNVTVIRNFPPTPQLSSVKTRPTDGNFRCIYAGVLSRDRGISQVVEAIAHFDLKNVELVLCGKFESAKYEAEVRKLKGFEKVDYRGWVEYEAVPDLFAGVDLGLVCIQPLGQHATGLPTKLFEYMAAGLPVVASSFPLWREIVEGNACGICVDPRDAKAIAEAIRYMQANPAVREEMGKNGRRAVLEKYNWEREEEKLLGLYAQLTNGHKNVKIQG